MKEWQIAIVVVCMAVALFVAIDSVAKAHDPCPKIECERLLDRLEGCQGNDYCATLVRVIESLCLPKERVQ